MLPLKHISKRKKRALAKHPSKKFSYQFLDHLIYFASIAGPIMTIPQIYDVWTSKNPSVSELTWGSYLIIAFVWLYYGIVHKEKPIILSNFLWIIAEGLVLAGLLHK